MSQRALADATGLSQSYIARRMTSEMPFTTEDLDRIALALGVPVLALLGAASAAPAA